MQTSPEPSQPHFQRQQLAFTAHIRDPQSNPLPEGIPARRMEIYTEIFFNGINDLISANFPLLHEITAETHWQAMVRDFMVRHRSETPLFTEVGLEFIDFLQNERTAQPHDWPFMLELAHYEYVELAVAISDAEADGFDPNGNLVDDCPVVAPTAWNLTYRWPVHRIGPAFLPTQAPTEPTHLVVYRDRQDEVHFLEINAVTQRLLDLLKENRQLTGLDALNTIAAELAHQDPAQLVAAGRELLDELHRRNVILGTRV
ncbi:MAG: putative DNA-binding domain-containing protein [Chromatiaceae bacterium]|nr:putative DNA-binding domain-containing protein [Chromatiaceae bacterium]